MDSASGGPGMNPAGFPHSEICGSRAICASPQLIAAYHVLHRLLTPRHPPNALSSLTEHSDARWQNFITRRPYSVVKDRNSTRRLVAGADDSSLSFEEWPPLRAVLFNPSWWR